MDHNLEKYIGTKKNAEKKVKIGGFSSNHYWSSNDGDEGLAWDQTFDDGYQDFADMNDDCNVRAVRAF